MKKALILLIFFDACGQINPTAQQLVDNSLAYYGGDHWDRAQLSFQFRNHRYVLQRDFGNFIYTRLALNDSLPYKDVLTSSGNFTRTLHGQKIILSDSMANVYTSSVNSVLYFVQIPYVLNDAAVVKERLPDCVIAGQNYFTLKITFAQEGGGEDFQDEFRYWMHQDTYAIDYMAYNYQTSGGGTRFRVATAQKNIAGMIVQDYANYKADTQFSPLDSLPSYFQQGKLQKVSTIVNTDWTLMD